MRVTLKSYLTDLSEREQGKPEGVRRDVPTLTELATVAGVQKGTMSRLVNGKIRALSFDIGERVLTELHKRGFIEAGIGDILAFDPPDLSEGVP